MKKQIISATLLAIGFVVGATALSALASSTWAPPDCGPTGVGCNTDTPINVGTSTQTKLGSLILNANTPIQNAIGLAVFGTSTFSGKVQIIDGTQALGKVLQSAADGTASWVSTSSLGITGSGGSSGGTFVNNFLFKRSAVYTHDTVVWCTPDHPYVVSCQTVDDQAPDAASLDTLSNNGCSSNDGICNTADDLTSLSIQLPKVPVANQRAGIDSDNTYHETVKKAGPVWGCLTYDKGHGHTSYRIDLVCSK